MGGERIAEFFTSGEDTEEADLARGKDGAVGVDVPSEGTGGGGCHVDLLSTQGDGMSVLGGRKGKGMVLVLS